MRAQIAVETPVSSTARAKQVSGAFDVPPRDIDRITWDVHLPLDEQPWTVGLIVGPSGSGKTTIMRHFWGDTIPLEWNGAAVIDDFPPDMKLDDIVAICQAVGFNTIPAWLRPYDVLSNGEKFRVELARRMAESTEDAPIVVDEFTSVVDRQVAKIGAHAVQKWVRRNNRQFIAVTCHYDVEDWLQPDWVYQPASDEFTWRSVQPRPAITVEVAPVGYEAWRLFAPYHYLTAELHRIARCYVAFVDDEPAAFAGCLHRPKSTKLKPGEKASVIGLSRLVTLPDWQGLGLAFVLCDTVAAAYKARGYRFHTYPAHPALMRSYDRSPHYTLVKAPQTKSFGAKRTTLPESWRMDTRPNATFRYIGPADDHAAATLLDCR